MDIEYEVVIREGYEDEYIGIILKIDGHEFELNKREVSNLEGIIVAVYDLMIDPFDLYLREEPPVRKV